MMSYGFDPYLSSWSPYHGAVYAVTESVAKIVAAGGDYPEDPLYLPGVLPPDDARIRNAGASLLPLCLEPTRPRWDSVFLPSEARTVCPEPFKDIDVPPTLVSFAVDVARQEDIITPELKKAGQQACVASTSRRMSMICLYMRQVMERYGKSAEDIKAGRIISAYALDRHGVAAAVSKMAFGNKHGREDRAQCGSQRLLCPGLRRYGLRRFPTDKVGELAHHLHSDRRGDRQRTVSGVRKCEHSHWTRR